MSREATDSFIIITIIVVILAYFIYLAWMFSDETKRKMNTAKKLTMKEEKT